MNKGILFIILGVIIILAMLLPITIPFKGIWLILIVIPSIINIIKNKNRLTNLIFTLSILFLFLLVNSLFKLIYFIYIIGLIFIYLGISYIYNKKNNSNILIDNNYIITLSKQDIVSNIPNNTLIEVTLGILNLDISKSIIKKNNTLKINNILSKTTITIPKNTNISIVSQNIFSIIKNNTKYNKKNNNTLYIEVFSFLGSVSIK